MKLHIVTPTEDIVETEAEEVYAYGPKGEFGVLPGHSAYLTPLGIGRLRFSQGGSQRQYAVAGGFLEVHGETVQVLADQVMPAERIDAAAAKRRVEELERELGQGIEDPEAFAQATQELDIQKARVAAAGN